MRTKISTSDFSLDEDLLNVFKEVFSDDPAGYDEVVRDTKKAFAFIRKTELKRNPNYDFNYNNY